MLRNPKIPMLCGLATRDLLLKQLKVDVPATYPRMEQNLSRFTLGILQVGNVAAGNEELQYFGTLFMLGQQIPWSEIDVITAAGRPKKRSRRPRSIGEGRSSGYSDPFEPEKEDL